MNEKETKIKIPALKIKIKKKLKKRRLSAHFFFIPSRAKKKQTKSRHSQECTHHQGSEGRRQVTKHYPTLLRYNHAHNIFVVSSSARRASTATFARGFHLTFRSVFFPFFFSISGAKFFTHGRDKISLVVPPDVAPGKTPSDVVCTPSAHFIGCTRAFVLWDGADGWPPALNPNHARLTNF